MGCVNIKNKVQNFQNAPELKRSKTLDELDKNAAVDYALKNIKQQKYSQIEIILSCSKIPNVDTFSLPNPLAVLYVDEKHGMQIQRSPQKMLFGLNDLEEDEEEEAEWLEKGRTEVRKGEPHPIFLNSVIFQSVNYQQLKFKVEVYAVTNSAELKKEHSNQVNLSRCVLVGEQKFRMQELLNHASYCTKQLSNPKKHKKDEILKEKKTTVTMRFEEIEQTNSVVALSLAMKLAILSKNSFFYTIYRGRELGEFVQVFTSEKQKNYAKIRWEQHDFPLKELCRNDEDRQLKVEVYESNRKNNVKMLGSTEFTLKEIISNEKKSFQITNKRVIFGELEIIKCQFQNRYTFLDYIHGGCDISLVAAMDFTMSNKPPWDPRSLHYSKNGTKMMSQNVASRMEEENEGGWGFRNQNPMNKKKEEAGNEYQEALKQTIRILDYYDTDCYIPFLGFGAKLPPYYNCVSQCFAVNGNIFSPEAFGEEGLIKAYNHGISEIQFHGPSAFAPAIRFVSRMACAEPVSQTNQFYIIMTIITNGGLSDMESTIDAIVAASEIPLSIIIIGVGDGDFSKMEVLDADDEPLVDSKGKVQLRDIVQFVPFRKYKGNLPEFARQVLEEIPKQIKDFFEMKGISPKDYKSQKKNVKRDVELLKRKRKQEKKKLENPYLKEQREKFQSDILKLGFEMDDIDMIIRKGLFSEDRNVAVDLLSQLKTNPDILKEEKEEIEILKKKRLEEEEKRKKNEEEMKKFTDVRRKFQIEMPLLTPEGFKPLQKHKKLCKICYESKIDTVIIPCGHKLFCVDCAKHVKKQCPICLENVDKVVKEFNVKNYVEKVRQL